MAAFDDEYETRTFTPVVIDGEPDAATRDWIAATRVAFHETNSASGVTVGAVAAVADGRTYTGIYDRRPLTGSLDATWPVATYADYVKTINVGGGALLDALLISDVTVRPTHKRKGMLRRMMTARLTHAADDGIPLAALTASESGIYRRFGFGASTRVRRISIRPEKRFELLTPPAGRCELARASDIQEIARDVFARFHARTPGSVDRQHQLWNRRLGLGGDEPKLDESVRAALYYSPAGDIDGYVTYRLKEEGHTAALEVIDLVPATDEAYLGLWQFIGTVDLVDRITYGVAPVVDPLLEALVESRTLETTGEEDHVWFRILDPVAALSARPYACDGTLTIKIHDDLGFSAGVFELSVSHGAASVRRIDANDSTAIADLALDTATLARAFVGGTPVTALAAAGLVEHRDPAAVRLATAMFMPDRPVYGITYF
ncbi:GNAT family N-acetyltransferase [Frondihabitans australicus]|uniref:Putative acetyltransferase n=1 Tax=Frondihabitans australicus TaxID=386892 RepID=A0A495ILR3_9MICO|nr:GNAT family N-acetyltransferase [Frondihabitans australicus]RKR76106.1 putative acetyltransferase [Frondihabitans australicus]